MRCLFLLFIIVPISAFRNDLSGCAHAPSMAARRICEQINAMDERSRETIARKGPTKHVECSTESSWNDCMNLECFCRGHFEYQQTGSLYNGNCMLPSGQQMKKAIRKEYRTLSDQERRRFHYAMWRIKQNGRFDVLARLHHDYSEGSSAHSGPGFLPWHREFLKQFEFELRRVDIDVAIPYWDSTLDSVLPNPVDSIIWSSEFMGNTQGLVNDGPFADWQTIHNNALTRAVGADVNGTIFTEHFVQSYMNFQDIDHALGITAPRDIDWKKYCPHYRPTYTEIEYIHGYVHLFVGGHMHETNTSANDPIFYLLHSFVDKTWEDWRVRHQNRRRRSIDYPRDNENCFNKYHFKDSPIYKHNRCSRIDNINKLGLSNEYLDNLYEYAPKPTCPSCGDSPYLFCMKSTGKCASKVRVGGNCTRLENEDACYDSKCVDGKCVAYADLVKTLQQQKPAFNGIQKERKPSPTVRMFAIQTEPQSPISVPPQQTNDQNQRFEELMKQNEKLFERLKAIEDSMAQKNNENYELTRRLDRLTQQNSNSRSSSTNSRSSSTNSRSSNNQSPSNKDSDKVVDDLLKLASSNMHFPEHALNLYERAKDAEQRGSNDPSRLALIWNNIGMCYYKMERYAEALSATDTAINLNRENARSFYNRALIYQKLRNPYKAIEDLNHALQLDPYMRNAYTLKYSLQTEQRAPSTNYRTSTSYRRTAPRRRG